MTSPVQSLEDAFQFNSSLARALLPHLPSTQRPAVAQWLDKLGGVGAGLKGARRLDSMRIRNDYMWFLLLVLRGGKLTEPFRSPPPPGPLPPLHEVLPDRVYEEVLSAAAGAGEASPPPTPEHSPVTSKPSKLSIGTKHEKKADVHPEPRHFLATRPRPKCGVCIYMGAFSAQGP